MYIIMAMMVATGSGCTQSVTVTDTKPALLESTTLSPTIITNVIPEVSYPKPTQEPITITPKKPNNGCDQNYSGCVPVASDVDCAGGSGNGPAYAQGPLKVIGIDKYDLDKDGDGIACE